MTYDLNYLKLLSKQYPTIDAVSTEIVNLSAIINLPKGTEHFLADIHGEDEAFEHVMRNASGVVKRKIDDVFQDELSEQDKKALATLVYYPRQKLALVKQEVDDLEDYYKRAIYRLILLCRETAYKYSRSKVRKTIPVSFQYILEELLHENEKHTHKKDYYRAVIESIINTGQADAFIITTAEVIRKLVVDHLHIIGDIYDRGTGAHRVLDTLMKHHSVDIQWGNHDVLWIGAACGSTVCMADVIRVSLRYGNLGTLQEGYGINLSPLVRLALDRYDQADLSPFSVKSRDDKLTKRDLTLLSRMQLAISIILFKLEGQLIDRRPTWGLNDRKLLQRIDFERGVIQLEQGEFKLVATDFPTIDPNSPYRLSEDEQDVVDKLALSFKHATDLQRHIRFMIDQGSMYKVINGNLLYHGCIPIDSNGQLKTVELFGVTLSGKSLLDFFDNHVRRAYFTRKIEEKQMSLDLIWYLWCGAYSPLFGKTKMATFERYYIADDSTHKEEKDPYYAKREDVNVCNLIFEEFGLNPASSHIINGHVPVRVIKGELPIKANGRLITIDGGFAKAYQKVTGIAGYTLIYNSQGMHLVSHKPFSSKKQAIEKDLDMLPTSVFIEKQKARTFVGDTDKGAELKADIEALKALLDSYRQGILKQRN